MAEGAGEFGVGVAAGLAGAVADVVAGAGSGVSFATSHSEMAVFYRTNAQTRALEEIFIRSALPYRVIGGTKFYERLEIKDVLAYLAAVANPDDGLAHRRILNTPNVSAVDLSSLDFTGATIRLVYTRSLEELQGNMQRVGLSLTQGGEGWVIQPM